MNLKYGFISVDDHVQEVRNLWTDRLEKNSAKTLLDFKGYKIKLR